jgi:hypothetical protein
MPQWHIVRLAKIAENAILRRMAACIVSFVDLDGIRHSVEVEAEGLYEASVLGLCAFRKPDLGLGLLRLNSPTAINMPFKTKSIQNAT